MEVINDITKEFRVQLLINLIKYLRSIIDIDYRNFKKWYNSYSIDKLILIHPEISPDMTSHRNYFVYLDNNYHKFIIPPMTYDYVVTYKDICYRLKIHSDYTKHDVIIEYENWNDYLYNGGPVYTSNELAMFTRTIKKQISAINMYQIYDMAIEYVYTLFEMKNMTLSIGYGCIELKW